MPWPMRPAPTIPIRALSAMALPRGVAAVGVKDVSGVEIRGFRSKEEERTSKIFRLAEAALGHPGEETGADGIGALVILEHPCSQRRAEDRRGNGVDGDAARAPLAAERLGHAVECRFRGEEGGVAGRMTEETAGRRHQDDLAAPA